MLETSSSLLLLARDRRDHAAWSRLVCLYTPLLTAWVRRAGVHAQDVDDLVQEVLLAVARDLPSFGYDRSRGSFRGWLRVILTNRCRHHLRSRPATLTVDVAVLDELEDEASDLALRWDVEHDQQVAARLLIVIRTEFESLTWTAFDRVVIGGEKPAAVANALGMSVNSVYQARSRVLARLRLEAGSLLD